jgi:RimJ/RimL family protein N-acetyltransferase
MRPTPSIVLRDVRPADLDAYVRMRCDPAMMADLGGAQAPADMERKVLRDAREAAADREWILMIVPDDGTDSVAGTVVIYPNAEHGDPYSEIGWMVLPAYQGRGFAKSAVRMVLNRARDEHRWGPVHAFPSITNKPSNGICRSLGFSLLGQEQVPFAGQVFTSNHWRIDPQVDALL